MRDQEARERNNDPSKERMNEWRVARPEASLNVSLDQSRDWCRVQDWLRSVRMRDIVLELCSPACAGRAPGTPGGVRARHLVRDAMRAAGLDPAEQRIGRSSGVNVVATIPGELDRWVLIGAHYDHLGGGPQGFFPGADDNAAAVAILVEVARALRSSPVKGRGVIIAAFDAEEPPYFATGEMGSAYYVRHPTEVGPPLDRIDLMICMDLVGHSFGVEGLPDEVRSSLFALGAERSEGTSAIVDELADSEPGLKVRRLDAEIIPPLSDYDAFWRRRIPFLFLTGGRSARYHTREDLPEFLDWNRMMRTARWLESLVRRVCSRESAPTLFREDGRDDLSTLRSFEAMVRQLEGISPLARSAIERVVALQAQCDAKGRLPTALAAAPTELVLGLEALLR